MRELEVESRRAQDEALQAYLDQMGQLLLDKDRPLRQSKEGDEVRIVARVRTLTILSQLNGERKGNVMRFLLEAGLIRGDLQGSREEWTYPVITLFAADLRDVDLSTYDWSAMVLTEADLRGANMSVCSLAYAFLTGANLEDGFLVASTLDGANLNGAYLRGICPQGSSESSLIPSSLWSEGCTLGAVRAAHSSPSSTLTC